MRKMKCGHPRRAFNLMKDFLNTASDLEYTCEDDDCVYPIEIRLSKSEDFCAQGIDSLDEAEDGTLEIGYNFNELWDESAKIFRAYWTDKCSLLKGFADITISTLHELGHIETTEEIRPNFSIQQREKVVRQLSEQYKDYRELNYAYFALPDETAATEWAINWLSDAENRKIAKAFEKKFFACFTEI